MRCGAHVQLGGGGGVKVLQNPSFCCSISGPHQRYEYLSPVKKWPCVYRFLCLKLYSFVFPLSPNLWSAFYYFTFIKSGLLEIYIQKININLLLLFTLVVAA